MQEKDKTQNNLPEERLDAAREEMRNRLAQLWLQGVRHFPVAQEQVAWQRAAVGQVAAMQILQTPGQQIGAAGKVSQTQNSPAAALGSRLSRCRACPICTDAKPAFWQATGDLHSASLQPEAAAPSFLVIVDQPLVGNTLTEDFADPNSPNNLILRLLDRAGIRSKTQIVYALRSVLNQMPADSMLKTCAETWLSEEINLFQPKCVFCFGGRAKTALDYALRQAKPAATQASSSQANQAAWARAGSHSAMVVQTFPSSLELQQFPSWRQAVWAEVTAAVKSFA